MKLNLSVVALLALVTVVAGGATLRVPLEHPTIQAGIDSAAVGDTVLVAAGTYTGSGNRGIEFRGKDIALVSEGGPSQTKIDCESLGRAFRLRDGETRDAVIEGFAVVNGFAYRRGGGALFESGASPTVRSCVFSKCHVHGEGVSPWPAFGGGVYVDRGGDPLFESCTFVGNSLLGSPAWGTDLATCDAVATLQNCLFGYGTIGGEFSSAWYGYEGGALDLTIERCIFTNQGAGPERLVVADPGLCDWYPGSQKGYELCGDSPALPYNNEWGQLVGAVGFGCGPCVTAVESLSWGAIKGMYR